MVAGKVTMIDDEALTQRATILQRPLRTQMRMEKSSLKHRSKGALAHKPRKMHASTTRNIESLNRLSNVRDV